MSQTLSFPVLVLVSVLLICNSAHACSCNTPNVENGLRESNVVFQGTIRDISHQKGLFVQKSFFVEFDVNRVWKGDVKDRFRLYTVAVSPGGCEGLLTSELIVGKELIVYAYRNPSWLARYTTNICTRTGPIEDRKEDVQQLGEGHPPRSEE